jgi:hypothetical protein
MDSRDVAPVTLLLIFGGGLVAHALTGLHFIILWLGVLGIAVTCFSVIMTVAARDLPHVALVDLGARLPSTAARLMWAVFGVPTSAVLLRNEYVGLGVIMIAMLASAVVLVSFVEHRLKAVQ